MNWEGFERVYGPEDESWENFKKQFPGADFSQFKEVDGNIIFKPTGEVLYRKGDLQPKAVLDIINDSWPQSLRLGNHKYGFIATTEYVKPDITLRIRVDDKNSFVARVRDVFTQTRERSEPSMNQWKHQLNFAVWCATGGCGVGLDLMKNSIFMFHFHFTVRRILYELQAPIPGDKVFSEDNSYDETAYNRLLKEFNTEDNFTNLSYKNCMTRKSLGLTKAGLGRINRSIEAFVYCVLGAQVNTRSSIVGQTGSAIETRQEFLTLFESSIIENDISKGVQRYQMVIQDAKARLDYAVAPGCWLMPSSLVINTGAMVGYNNKLQRATEDMKPGVNNVNSKTTAGIPRFVDTKKTHIDTPPKKVPAPKKVVKPLPTIREEPEYDHTLLKVGMSLGAVGLGFYIWR